MDIAIDLKQLKQLRDNMNIITKRILFWSPRVLCILFAIFISLFALDVFSEDYSAKEMILALIMHLIPTFMIIILLFISWRWEGIGAILFIVFPLFYLLMSRGESWIISGPLFLVGVLFLMNWIYRDQLKTATETGADLHY